MAAVIPWHRPDLRPVDAERVVAALQAGSSRDLHLARRWEEAWANLWERPCLAFPNANQAWRCLQQVMAWPVGTAILSHPFLPHCWQDAMTDQGMVLTFHDCQAETGLPILPPLTRRDILVMDHSMPQPRPAGAGVVIEEVATPLLPNPDCGHGDIQLLWLLGVLHGGTACLLFARDEALIQAMGRQRPAPPVNAVCELGLSQLDHLPALLAARANLVRRYHHLLRPAPGWRKPAFDAGQQVHTHYILQTDTAVLRHSLADYLLRSHIHCGYPARRPVPAGAFAFWQRLLALPVHASLSLEDHKRVINRVNRWRET